MEILNINMGTGPLAKNFQAKNEGYLSQENRIRNHQVISAIIKIPSSTDEYISQMRKIHKGNAVRDAQKAKRMGYFCEYFPYEDYVEDIHKINTSASFRQGRPMNPSYGRSVEELRLAGVTQPIGDPTDYRRMFGVFIQKREDLPKLLCGYIAFVRMGEMGQYAMIIGHAKHLKNGIMYLLNEYIVGSIIKADKPEYQGMNYILYASYSDGTDGLKMWKKRTLFKPYYLNIL